MGAQFAFVEKYDKDLYEDYLVGLEKDSRLRVDTCAHDLRCALERLVKLVMQKCNVDDNDLRDAYREIAKGDRKNKWDLANKMAALNAPVIWKKLGRKTSPLPAVSQTRLLYQNGEYKFENAYEGLRNFGNAGSHDGQIRRNEPRLTYDNLVHCLAKLHDLLKSFFNAKEAAPFNADLMDIGEYSITESLGNPSDGKRTRCMHEYLGVRESGARGAVRYAILRQYLRGDVTEELLKHNMDFRDAVTEDDPDDAPRGLIRDVRLLEAGVSEFSIVAYEFRHKPLRLRDALPQLSQEERLQLCGEIATCFQELHERKPAFYHRLLTHESVYVCDLGKDGVHKWRPYIKFDFGKIMTGDANFTVLGDALRAKERVREKEVEKYISMDAWDQQDWEYADCWALSVLFGDILCGEIRSRVAEMSDIEKAGYGQKIAEMVDDLMRGTVGAGEAVAALSGE